MTRLLLVRHGETALNSAQRYWGRTDVPLGDVGIKQAECLRERLKDEKIDFVYSSTLVRAKDTASIIAEGRGLEITACPELKEIDFGKMEGLTFEEVKLLYPEVALRWRERDPNLVCPGGESLPEVEKRVKDFRYYLKRHGDSDTVLIVAHSGVLRTLACQLLNFGQECRWQIRLDLASLTIIDTYPEFAMLTLLNDITHLKSIS